MPDSPTNGQFILCLSGAVWFGISCSISYFRKEMRGAAMLASVVGLVFGSIALISHRLKNNQWSPLEDNFSALLCLALLIAVVSIYLQLRKTLGTIDWVLSPIIILLLILAAIFGKTMPRSYSHNLWLWFHLLSVFVGPIAFALAASSGVMYLLASRRLRAKLPPISSGFASLERLEKTTYSSISVGFILLSVAVVTGVILVMSTDSRMGPNWFWQPKVILSLTAYLIYALILHSPINPSFKGKRMARLSITGFVLLLGTIAISQVMS